MQELNATYISTDNDALQLEKFVDDEWYQSQLLKNWAENCKDSIEALTFITDQWQRENDYCIRISSKRKNSGEKNIEDHEIEALDFYPLKNKMDWMYLMMGCENPDKVYVLHGKVQEDDDGDFILGIDLNYDICGKRFSQDTGQTALTVKIESVEDPEGLFADIWGSGEEYYFLYDSKKQKGIVYEQSLLKMLSAIERIQEKNQLTLETVSQIHQTQYSEIASMMHLQKEALCEAGKDVFCDFDSQVYYRLVHNLLWTRINKDNISSYLRVLCIIKNWNLKILSKMSNLCAKKKNDSDNCLDTLTQGPEQLIEIMLKDIIKRNACTIEIHGYYGTEIGKKAIELFLKEQGIKGATVTYEKEIVNHVSQIINDTKRIWPKSRDNIYTVVCEFNMTKGIVFPDEMLLNPKKAICMFVKKEEILKCGIYRTEFRTGRSLLVYEKE